METKKQRSIYLIILASIFCLLALFSSLSTFTYATTDRYSTALEDLEKSEDFDLSDYPILKNDYSLEVIQIAESTSKELFIYVYQPSGQDWGLTATTIRLSTGVNENFNPQDYSLTLLNSQGTLFKYKVDGLTVKDDPIRYYDITAIFRPFDSAIDEPASGGNITTEKSFEVGKVYTAETKEDGTTEYSCTTTETIEITDKYVGFIRYEDGFFLHKAACDSHFVAFSTDYQIDHLLEASISYVVQSVFEYNKLVLGGYGIQLGESYPEKQELNRYDEVNENIWWTTYSWNRIETASEFSQSEDLTDEAKKNLANKQWVLRFVETPYTYQSDILGFEYEKTYVEVSEVTILRLKFETDGVVYNLGVVDNKDQGSGEPDNNIESLLDRILEGLSLVGKIILGIAVALIAIPIVILIFKGIVTLSKWLFSKIKKKE